MVSLRRRVRFHKQFRFAHNKADDTDKKKPNGTPSPRRYDVAERPFGYKNDGINPQYTGEIKKNNFQLTLLGKGPVEKIGHHTKHHTLIPKRLCFGNVVQIIENARTQNKQYA